MARRETLPSGIVRLSGARQTVLLHRLAPGRILFIVAGQEDGELFELATAAIEAEIQQAGGAVVIFVDSSRQVSMTTAARERWTAWSKAHSRDIRATHMLMRSKLIEMAMSLISLFVRGQSMRTYASAEAFVRAITAEVPGFAWSPQYDAALAADAAGARDA